MHTDVTGVNEIRSLKDLTKPLEQRVAELESVLEAKDKQLSIKDEQNAAHAGAVDSLGTPSPSCKDIPTSNAWWQTSYRG